MSCSFSLISLFFPPLSMSWAGWSGPALINVGSPLFSAWWWQTIRCVCVWVHSLGGVAHWSARLRSLPQNTNKGLARPQWTIDQLLFQPQNKSLSHQLPFFLRLLLEEDLLFQSTDQNHCLPLPPLFLFITSSDAPEGQCAISGWPLCWTWQVC